MISTFKFFILRLKVKYYFLNARNHGYDYIRLIISNKNLPISDMYIFLHRLTNKIDNELYRKKKQLQAITAKIDNCNHPTYFYMLNEYKDLCTATYNFYESFIEFIKIETTIENSKNNIETRIFQLTLLDEHVTQQCRLFKECLYRVIKYGFYLPIVMPASAYYATMGHSYFYTLFIMLLIFLIFYPIYYWLISVILKFFYVPNLIEIAPPAQRRHPNYDGQALK